MDYQRHRKELLKDKDVRAEMEKLQLEFELARSIIKTLREPLKIHFC